MSAFKTFANKPPPSFSVTPCRILCGVLHLSHSRHVVSPAVLRCCNNDKHTSEMGQRTSSLLPISTNLSSHRHNLLQSFLLLGNGCWSTIRFGTPLHSWYSPLCLTTFPRVRTRVLIYVPTQHAASVESPEEQIERLGRESDHPLKTLVQATRDQHVLKQEVLENMIQGADAAVAEVGAGEDAPNVVGATSPCASRPRAFAAGAPSLALFLATTCVPVRDVFEHRVVPKLTLPDVAHPRATLPPAW
jgi:hypothetical protein